MQLVFRKFPAKEVPPPGPGEVYVRPDPTHAHEARGLADLVLRHGPAALLRGPGAAERLVVDVAFTHPTLDDMLAAAFAERLLEGKELPPGCQAFADYAAVVRQGLRPADVAPEDSIEGIFLAVRNAAGKDADLTDAAVGERFRKDWARVADCLLEAAAKGVNPLTASPFAGRSDFMHERAFLLRDRAVYRQDVLRGERWLVRLPGGPEQASALFLRQPTSLFFPHWSRTDADAPCGGAYLLLAVHWGQGVWVISTDPAQRLPIPTLAAALQAAEVAHDPVRAAGDPWYDGRRNNFTLVAAPRAGTVLSEPEVLRVVKKWAHARPAARPRWGFRLAVGAALVLLALGAALWAFVKPGEAPPPGPTLRVPGQPPPVVVVQRDPRTEVIESVDAQELTLPPHPQAAEAILTVPLAAPWDVEHTARMAVSLTPLDGKPLPPPEVEVTVNGQKHKAVSRAGATDPREVRFDAGDVTLRAQNEMTVRVVNAADAPRSVTLRVKWRNKGTLYVLAVGVTKYADPSLRELTLPGEDATALAQTLQSQQGQVFEKVDTRTLLNDKTRRDDIFGGLAWLKERCTARDLAVVVLAGHGVKSGDGFFFFAPSDYDPKSPRSKGLSATDLLAELGTLPCDTLLLLDCCHSGAFSGGIALPGGGNLTARRGLMVFAAARADEESRAKQDWGHGALTLAVLEALTNRDLLDAKARPPFPEPLPDGLVTLKDLDYFVAGRVRRLTGNEQSFNSFMSGDMAPQRIPIAPQGK